MRSLGDMHTYNQEWSKKFRISDENLRHLKKLKYHSSIREKNKDFDIVNFDIYSQKENLYSNEDDTLVSAKVFVLTDSLCASSCWLNVREFLQVPGIVHIGKTTAIQTLYSEVRGITLPSKNFTFVFPIHQFLSPLNNLYF